MKQLLIHSVNGELRGFEAPEKPIRIDYVEIYESGHSVSDAMDHERKLMHGYNQAISEAAKNSLKILNPEVVPSFEGQYYEWPGTYEINEYCRRCAAAGTCLSEDLCSAVPMIKLTPPAALEEEPHIKVKGQGYIINKWPKKSKEAALEEESQEDLWEQIYYKLRGEFPKGFKGSLIFELKKEFHITRK